jgi:ribosomal protein S18 acetylase RimI-like enzyme
MTLRFRPAVAGDVAQAVPLMYSAGPEGFEYVFTQGRRSALDYLRYAFADGAGVFGHRNHTVVEQDGSVVGIGAFYSGVEYNQLSQGTLLQILRFYNFSCLPVLRRAMQTTHWMPPPGRRTLYVANLGVAPEMRGQGIGARLLHEQMKHARNTRKAQFALDVAETKRL